MGFFDGLFGGGDNKTTATSAPWKGSEGALKDAIAGARNLYNSGIGGQVYTGSTVVPWSQQSQQGMDTIGNIAKANMWGKGVSGEYNDIIKQGGYNNQQMAAAGTVDGLAKNPFNSQQNSAMSGTQSLANSPYNWQQKQAMQGMNQLGNNPFNSQQNNAMGNVQQTANSQFDINSNPAFQSVLKQAQDSASEAVNNNAAAAGRYGSGTNQQLLATEVGDLTARMVGNEYNNWQNRKDTANQNLFNMGQAGQDMKFNANQAQFGMGQAGQDMKLNANNSLFNQGQAGQDMKLNAANSGFNMGQNAINNLGTAFQGMQDPAKALMQVGGMKEDLASRQMNDRLRIFNESQNKPWELLGRLNAIGTGAGQMGGTTTQTQPGQNPFLSVIGAGLGGGGLLSSFF